MISSRDMILGRIRASLNRDNDMSFDDDALKQRMRTHPRHPLPAFDEVLAVRFQQKIEAAHATVTQVDSLSAVTGEVIRYLDENSVARELVVSGETLIEQIDWRGELQVEQRLPTETDAVSVTSAFCAIAETGSLMLVSGERSATSLNFLPDYHIVILQTEQIMRHMEDAWDHLRAKFDGMPRTVNFISGPSKTADVEQTVEYGAHGPRCLHVIMVH